MARLRLSAAAEADIASNLAWTRERFGTDAQTRYEKLLGVGMSDLLAQPERIGSIERPELGQGIRSYHLRHSRRRGGVAHPRHLILYRIVDGGVIEVGRVLHDAMDLERHARFVPPLKL